MVTFDEKKAEIWKDDLWRKDLMSWAEKAYSKEYYETLCYTNFTYDVHGRYHEELVSMILKQFPEGSIKNVGVLGCGKGFSVRAWKKHGFSVKGCDISKYATDNAIEPEVIRADIKSTPYSDNEFDIVCNSSVLEHIFSEHFDDVVKEIHRVCKKYCFFLTVFSSSRYDATDYTHVIWGEGGEQRSKEWYRRKFEKYFDVEFMNLFPILLPGEIWECLILKKKSL